MEGNERKRKGKSVNGKSARKNTNVWTELAKSTICREDKEERETE